MYHFLCFYVLESLSCWWGKDGYLDVVLLYYVVIYVCRVNQPLTSEIQSNGVDIL